MAIRQNCIEYGFQTTSPRIASGSWYTFSPKRIDIPETGSRVFTDVILQFYGRNSGAEVTTTTSDYTMSVQIDNNPSASLVFSAGLFNQTIEQIAYTYLNDATSYFNTYFTASTHNVTCGFMSPRTNTIGQSFKLICSYKLDDASITKSIKTVRLPINSPTGSSNLGTTEVTMGGYASNIPAFDTYLPENSKVFRDIFIEYHANDTAGGTQTYQVMTRIDNAASASRFAISSSLSSSPAYYEIETLSGSLDTSTTHSLWASTTQALRQSGFCGIIYCTYEYDYTGSTTIMNSIVMNLADSQTYTPKNAFGRYSKKFYIPESNVIPARSAMFLTQTGAFVLGVLAGTASGSLQTHNVIQGLIQTGYTPMMVQLDGTGSGLTPIQINSGWNEVPVYVYTNSDSSIAGIFTGAVLYLNYYSSNLGSPLTHNKTIFTLPEPVTSLGNGSTSWFYASYYASSSIDTNYYIQDVSNWIYYLFAAAANVPIYNIGEIAYQKTGSEVANGSDIVKISSFGVANDARYNTAWLFGDMTSDVKRYPEYDNSRNPKVDISTRRKYLHRIINASVNAVPAFSHMQSLTYSSNLFKVTGSIQNYSGTGAGIPLTVYNYNTGEKLFATSSKTGGIIDAYWYDRHDDLIIIADSGSRYASNVLPANSGSFLITIPTQNSGGEKSFTFIG